MAESLGKIALVFGCLMGDIRALFQGGDCAEMRGEPSMCESGEVRLGSVS